MNPTMAAAAVLLGLSAATDASAQPLQQGKNEFGAFEPIPPTRYEPCNEPKFLPAANCGLPDDTEVIALHWRGESRAYPVRQIVYHHVVNDRFGAQRLAVTYCGIARTSATFHLGESEPSLRAAGMFGGMLALCRAGDEPGAWAQISETPVPENVTDTWLRPGPAPVHTTLGRWRAVYPNTTVLAPDPKHLGHFEAYDRKPKTTGLNPLVMSTLFKIDERIPPDTEVFGVALGEDSIAWPLDYLQRERLAKTTLGGRVVTVLWDDALETPRVAEADFEGVATRSYWFAWGNFHPNTIMAEKEVQDASK